MCSNVLDYFLAVPDCLHFLEKVVSADMALSSETDMALVRLCIGDVVKSP